MILALKQAVLGFIFLFWFIMVCYEIKGLFGGFLDFVTSIEWTQ